MPPVYWLRVLKMGAWPTRLSGVTSELSTVNRGMEEWIASLAASPAPTSASLESRQESMESIPASGSSTCVLFAKCNPDLSLSKTSLQSSLFQQEEPYSEGLPDAGMMRSGLLYELPKWEPRTAVNERSFSHSGPEPNWGTPRVTTNSGIPCPESTGNGSRLEDQAGTWLTPAGMNGQDHTGKQGRGGEFAKQVTEWQTPATDSFRSRGGDRKDEMGLDQEARFWTTPQAHDVATGNPDRVRRFGTLHGGANLTDDVTAWPTPKAISGGANSQRENRPQTGGADLQRNRLSSGELRRAGTGRTAGVRTQHRPTGCWGVR